MPGNESGRSSDKAGSAEPASASAQAASATEQGVPVVKDTMPPPQGQPVNSGTFNSIPGGQGPNSGTRQDSISIYTNFNQPRLSTDSSISSFLNIDNQSEHRVSTSQMSQVGTGSGSTSLAQELSYNRGYSIVNNLWNSQAGAQPQGDVAFNSARRQSEQLEPFMPKFNTSSFSQPSKGMQPVNQAQLQQKLQQQNLQNLQQPQGNGNSVFSSKRNSLYFPGTDAELDFFNSGKRNSSVAMKPPVIRPNINGLNQQISSNEDMDPAFFQNTIARKDSIKFNPEDFADFQFKRRDSSVRATLDNSNYMPAPPKKINEGSLSPIEPPLQADEDVDDDVETRLHKRLTSLVDVEKENTGPPTKKRNTTKKKKKGSHVCTKHDHQHEHVHAHAHTHSHMHGDAHDHDHSHTHMHTESDSRMGSLPPISSSISSTDDNKPLLGATKVDQLMLVIQARKNGVTDKVSQSADGSLMLESAPAIIPPMSQLVGGVERPKSKSVKQFQCPYCQKFFSQSTHLEVHVRSHIGYKPFECEFCGKRFTQGGNLRTHIRLHTGEKPYECETCGRKFSRKGNLAAHKLTHENLKPFQCKLDNCNKTFSQLGNMKAHQNRFHLQTLNRLTQRLAEMDPNENISEKERELLDYFASIYKNSNRGIKGRGKGNPNIVPLNAFHKHRQIDDPTVRVAAKALGSLTNSKQPSPNAGIPDKSNQFSYQSAEGQLDEVGYNVGGGMSMDATNIKDAPQKEKVHFKDVNFIR